MSGPRKIIDLDGRPEESWRLDSSAVHLWQGELWRWEPIGCILCIEEEGIPHETLSRVEGEETLYCCMNHGPLDRVPYRMRKDFEITLGGVTREGFEEITDAMLFPRSMTEEERTAIIHRLLDEIEADERADTQSVEPDDPE